MDNDICTVEKDVPSAVKSLLSKMIEKRKIDDPIVNLYYGDAVSEEECETLLSELEELFPDAEFLPAPGGQPLYYYYLSVE